MATKIEVDSASKGFFKDAYAILTKICGEKIKLQKLNGVDCYGLVEWLVIYNKLSTKYWLVRRVESIDTRMARSAATLPRSKISRQLAIEITASY